MLHGSHGLAVALATRMKLSQHVARVFLAGAVIVSTVSAQTKSASMPISVVVSPNCVMNVTGGIGASAVASLACPQQSTAALVTLTSSYQPDTPSLASESDRVLSLNRGTTRVVVPSVSSEAPSDNRAPLILTVNF